MMSHPARADREKLSSRNALHYPREEVIVRIGRGRKASFCSQ